VLSGSQIKNRSITARKVALDTLTGREITESSLGTVRTATLAQRARRADAATNATNLDGQPASAYRLHCPTGLQPAAEACFETTTRPSAGWEFALKTLRPGAAPAPRRRRTRLGLRPQRRAAGLPVDRDVLQRQQRNRRRPPGGVADEADGSPQPRGDRQRARVHAALTAA